MLFSSLEPWKDINDLLGEMIFKNYSPSERTVKYPLLNAWSNEEETIVKTEIPGIEPEKLDITIQDDIMILEGEKKLETGENIVYHRKERFSGKFKRRVQLPFRIESEKVEANYKDGILTIKLPRAEQDKPKKIEIKS